MSSLSAVTYKWALDDVSSTDLTCSLRIHTRPSAPYTCVAHVIKPFDVVKCL